MAGKLTVALLFGGRSSEHSISCATAGGVLSAIDRDRYDVIPIGVTADGSYVLEQDDPSRFTLGATLPVVIDNGTRIRWPESSATRELVVIEADGTSRSLGPVDIVFPILHGRWGEDGTLQGMLELVDLPYVGNGVLASAVAMDKHFTKTVLAQAGIAVADGHTVSRRQWEQQPGEVTALADGLGWPVIVKPCRAGSSVGVTKVAGPAGFEAAMAVAFEEDDRVLIEAMLIGREIECGVLSARDGGRPRVSVAGEIVVSTESGFYDFAAKYQEAPGIDLVCPADLTDAELVQLRDIAARAFEAIGGEGLARVDCFLTSAGFVVNEINTMPGFTPISMFPACWMATGMTYPQLIDELIVLGLAASR